MRRGLLLFILALVARADPPLMLEFLDSKHEEVATGALNRLRKLGPAIFADTLKALPKMGLAGQRRAALLLDEFSRTMGTIEPHGAKVLGLVRKSEDAVVRARLARACHKCGPKSAPGLFRLIPHEDAAVREMAVDVIVRIGEPAWPRVRRVLESPSDAFRVGGLQIVARSDGGVPGTEPIVRELCSNRSARVRAAAFRALENISSADDVVPMLLASLDDPDDRVADSAGLALAERGAVAAPGILARIESKKGASCEREIRALREFDAGAVAAVEKGLSVGPPAARLAVAQSLNPLTPAARACLRELSSSEDVSIRLRVVPMLGSHPDEYQLCISLTGDGDATVRAAALWVLASSSPTTKLAPLFTDRMEDPTADVRACAWLGLWNLGQQRANGELAALLGKDGSTRAADVIATMKGAGVPLAPALLGALDSKDTKVAVAATRALGIVLTHIPPGSPRLRSARFNSVPKRVRSACDNAWAWLEQRQVRLAGTRGRGWSSVADGGARGCDIGVSSLAMLAFTTAGFHTRTDRWGTVIEDASLYLRSVQRDDGHIGPPTFAQSMIQHAMATQALSEVVLVGHATAEAADAARKALAYARSARNPRFGWRYRARGGQNDTFITTWMLLALKTGEEAGLGADPEAYAQGLQWLDKMTGYSFERVGYNRMGGRPARMVELGSLQTRSVPSPWSGTIPRLNMSKRERRFYEMAKAARERRNRENFHPDHSQSLTAMATWARFRLGASAAHRKRAQVGARVVTELPPQWNPENHHVDLIFWLFGARALAVTPGGSAAGRAWRFELTKVLLDHQQSDGSWNAKGVWGSQGGRVYATATAVMALLGSVPYGPDLVDGTEPPLVALSRKRLKALLDDPRPEVVRAALKALG